MCVLGWWTTVDRHRFGSKNLNESFKNRFWNWIPSQRIYAYQLNAERSNGYNNSRDRTWPKSFFPISGICCKDSSDQNTPVGQKKRLWRQGGHCEVKSSIKGLQRCWRCIFQRRPFGLQELFLKEIGRSEIFSCYLPGMFQFVILMPTEYKSYFCDNISNLDKSPSFARFP